MSGYRIRAAHGAEAECYLVTVVFAGLSALSALWTPLLGALPLVLAAGAAVAAQAALSARRAFPTTPVSGADRLLLRTPPPFLRLLQPLARLDARPTAVTTGTGLATIGELPVEGASEPRATERSTA